MALTQKFRDAVLVSAVRICNIDMEKKYPVLHAERVETKYGESVLLTIRENVECCVKVFYRADSECVSRMKIFQL
jgi:hypothetical protein